MPAAQKLEHLKKLAALIRYYILTCYHPGRVRPPHFVVVAPPS